MHKKGLSTDSIILETIQRKPGATIAEIAQDLEWTNGKVDGSVNRLITEGKASIKYYLKRGTLVKKVYPVNHDKVPTRQITIPGAMINLDVWMQQAFVYALSRSTVGIAPRKVEEWDAKAFSKQAVLIGKEAERVVLELPERFAEFYQLKNSEISLSTVGDFVFVTVESILPIEL